MTDNVNVSYSFGTGATNDAPVDKTLYAFAPAQRINLGNGGVMMFNRHTGKQGVVTGEVASILSHCGRFQSLDIHAENVANVIPQLKGQAAEVRKVLDSLRDTGLLTSASDVTRRLSSGNASTAQPATRVFIMTCDRPAAVERLLESLLGCSLSEYDGIYLVDDSREAANQAANLAAIETFNLSSARAMHYVGADEQATIMTSLTNAAPDAQDSIRFLLDRSAWADKPSYGRARNLCLALSVGYRALMLDDDILCRAMRSPLAESGLRFGSIQDRNAVFADSLEALMQSGTDAGVDPLREISRPLGLNLATVTGQLQHNAMAADQLRGANAAMIDTLAGDSPILVSQCGSWGDPGTADGHWLVHLDPFSIGRMLDAEGGLARALQDRQCGISYPSPTISKTAVMSQLTGVDNDALLPPYFPAYRGEDALFGAMVAWLHPASAVLNHNWAVPHLPMEARDERGAKAPVAGSAGLRTAARYLTDRIDFVDGINAEQRLSGLANLIAELAATADDDLDLKYRAVLTEEYDGQLQTIGRQFQMAPQLESQNWQAYLQRAAEELQQALMSTHSLARMGEDGSVEPIKSGAAAFARCLAQWPAIREACRGLEI